ncbi:MAG: YdcF family protein [Acidimicrobiia bacterium]|nr:YdcF family protein [Acidimicrobiia bacterium]
MRWLVRFAGVAVAVGVLYVAATFVEVWWGARQDNSGPAEAIVVLGAAQWDGRPSPVLKARLDRAADLYAEGAAPVIVVTGGNQEGDRFTQGWAGYDYLRNEGIPDEALLVEVNGVDTFTELSATANILADRAIGNDVLVVSDPYHAVRAAAIAREVGLDPSFAPSSREASLTQLARETAAVAAGRLASYRRLSSYT